MLRSPAGSLVKLLDRAIQSFFDRNSSVEAQRRLVRPGEVVGLKVNCLGGKGASTSVPLVEAICERLQQAGIRINRLSEFVDTYSAAGKDLRAADERAIQRMTAYADREACRLCNQYLPHCRQQVPIADILRFGRYAVDCGDLDRARRLYAQLDRQADACTACGACLSHCPQGLRILDKLASTHRFLG